MDILSRINGLLGERTIKEIRREGSVLRVVERGKHPNQIRSLMYNNTVFSSIGESGIYTHSYWDHFIPLPALFDSPKVLVLGLGGGTIPYQIESLYPKADVSVVEFDKDMINISRAFLKKKLKARIINEDASSFLNRRSEKYHIVISDLYIDDFTPDQFLSRKFLSDARSSLLESGVFAANFATSARMAGKLSSFISEIEAEFGSCARIVPLRVPGNSILIAPKSGDAERIVAESEKKILGNREMDEVAIAYSRATYV